MTISPALLGVIASSRRRVASTAFLAHYPGSDSQFGTVSNGGRQFLFTSGASAWGIAWVRTLSAKAGKRYFETVNQGPQTTNFLAGFMARSQWNSSSGSYPGNPLGVPAYLAHYGTLGGATTGRIDNGSFAGNGAYTWGVGDVCCIAADFDAGKVWYGKNGAWLSGDPAAGTGAAQTLPDGNFDVYVGFYQLGSGTRQLTCNFSAANFAYPAPSGFVQLV